MTRIPVDFIADPAPFTLPVSRVGLSTLMRDIALAPDNIDHGPAEAAFASDWLAKQIPAGLSIKFTQVREFYRDDAKLNALTWTCTVMDGGGYWATAEGTSPMFAAEALLREREKTEAINANMAQIARDALPKETFTIWGKDGVPHTFKIGTTPPVDTRMGTWEAMGTVVGLSMDAERKLREMKGAA